MLDIDVPPVPLVDVLDRVLGQGAVVTGEIVISLAGIDLMRVSLQALLASVRAGMGDPSLRRREGP